MSEDVVSDLMILFENCRMFLIAERGGMKPGRFEESDGLRCKQFELNYRFQFLSSTARRREPGANNESRG